MLLSQIRRGTTLLLSQTRRGTKLLLVKCPESVQAAVSPDVIEHASSESCSPPHTFDSPRHRKQKLDHLWRHSIPDYQVRPVPSPASSSRPAAMEADASLPPTKWGRCHVCAYSPKPTCLLPEDLLDRCVCYQYEDNKRLQWEDLLDRCVCKPSVGSFPLPLLVGTETGMAQHLEI